MRNTERALQLAPGAGSNAVKPEAPDDLWEQIDVLRAEVANDRPANSVTTAEWAERYGLTVKQAYGQLEQLCARGKMQSTGTRARRYYVLVKK